MPLDIRESKLELTTMKDFDNNPIFKGKSDEAIWFFSINEEVMCPMSIHRENAWVIKNQVVELKDKKKLISVSN